jgi:transketolase
MKYNKDSIDNPDRDRFVLSKGHGAPALYAVFKQLGLTTQDELNTLRQIGSPLQGHPDKKKLKGVEMSTGSLGQGLSVANGMALAARLDKSKRHIYALLGDGEMQEGQVWEAALTAANYKLSNLTAIIDRNGLQIDGKTEQVKALGDVAEKLRAFGWDVKTINGHDYSAIIDALKYRSDRPVAIVASTIKGCGVSFMENEVKWHGTATNTEETAAAIKELEQARVALTSSAS